MNKTILATFVLLCAIQACSGQFFFINLIVSSVVAIVNTVFNLVINFSTIAFSFATVSIQFVAQASISILANLNRGLHSSVVSNNRTLTSLGNVTANFTLRVNNCSALVSPLATFLGRLAVNTLRVDTTDLSFTFQASAIALAGYSYSNPPPATLLIDGFTYAVPSSLCAPSSVNSTNTSATTIACQVATFNYTSRLHIQALNRTARRLEKINEYLNADCLVYNATEIQSIIEQWVSLQAAVNAYANETVNNGTTLIAFANATIGVNITRTFNRSQELINSIINSTACIVEAVCNNLTNPILSFSVWADFSAMADLNTRYFRRLSLSSSVNGFNRHFNGSASVLAQLNSATANFSAIVNGYRTLKVLNYHNAGMSIVGRLNAFVNRTRSSSSAISAILNATIVSTETNKTISMLNATATINATASAIASLIISQNSSYPQCAHYINITANAFANFSSDLQYCGIAADYNQDAEYMYAANYTANLTSSYISYVNAITQCYITHCAGNSDINSYSNAGFNCIRDRRFYITNTIWFFVATHSVSPTGQNFINCINAVSNNVLSGTNSIDATTNVLLTNLRARIYNISAIFQNCLQTMLSEASATFSSIRVNYNDCTQEATTTVVVTTTADTTTTTTVSP